MLQDDRRYTRSEDSEGYPTTTANELPRGTYHYRHFYELTHAKCLPLQVQSVIEQLSVTYKKREEGMTSLHCRSYRNSANTAYVHLLQNLRSSRRRTTLLCNGHHSGRVTGSLLPWQDRSARTGRGSQDRCS